MNPMQSRAGKTVTIQPGGYLAFEPNPLPPEPPLRQDKEFTSALYSATLALGRLSGLSRLLPNPDLFVAMYVRREALLSSRIEGIESTLTDVLRHEESNDESKAGEPADVAKVVNYVRAINLGIEKLGTTQLSMDMLRELHGVLLENDPRGERRIGHYRDAPNWIGAKGSTLMNAQFVPPPPDRMLMSIENLDYYIRESQDAPVLIQAGLAHAQFQTVHPFFDGNGRIGRLLIALMLHASKTLDKPLLYLSHYFLQNRIEYTDRLTAVRSNGDWEGWMKFFLQGVQATADDAVARSARIIDLRIETLAAAGKLKHRTSRLVEFLFAHPIVTVKSIERDLGISDDTAIAALRELEAAGIVREQTGRKRGRVYVFERYVEILEADSGPPPAIAMAPLISGQPPARSPQ